MSPLRSREPMDALPPGLIRSLRRYGRSIRRARAAHWGGWTLIAAGATLSAALLLDRFVLLSGGVRIILSLAFAASAAVPAAVGLWRVCRAPGPLSLARRIEAARPDLDEALYTSVELATGARARKEAEGDKGAETAKALREALWRDTAVAVESRPLPRASGRGVAQLWGAVLSIWGALAVGSAVAWEDAGRLLARLTHPTLDLPRPTTVVLELLPGTTAVALGADVPITIRALRGTPREASLRWRVEGGSWIERTVPMEPVKLGAASSREAERSAAAVREGRHTLPGVRQAIEYEARAGDFQSLPHRLSPRDPPRPLRFRWKVRPPAYARWPEADSESDAPVIEALRGSRLDLTVEASEALRAAPAVWREEGAAPRPLELEGKGSSATARELSLERTARVDVELVGLDGVRSPPITVTLLARVDAPPRAEITSPQEAEMTVEPSSRLPLEGWIEDDVGLARAELIVTGPARDGAGRNVGSAPVEGAGEATVGPEWTPPAGTPSTSPPSPASPGGPSGLEIARISLVAPPPDGQPRPRGATLAQDLDVARLGLGPGDSVEVRIEAADALGQVASSRVRRLRVGLLPGSPEGTSWPAPLRETVLGLEGLLDAWKSLPGARGELEPGPVEAVGTAGGVGAVGTVGAPGTVSRGEPLTPALAESLERASDAALALADLALRLGEEASASARSLEVPSLGQEGLARLGLRVRRIARGEIPAWWEATLVVLGARRASSSSATERPDVGSERGGQPSVNAALEALGRAHRGAGAALEETLSDGQLLLRSEVLDEALHLSSALVLELASSPAPASQDPASQSGLEASLGREGPRLGLLLRSIVAPQSSHLADTLDSLATRLLDVLGTGGSPGIGSGQPLQALLTIQGRLEPLCQRQRSLVLERLRKTAPMDLLSPLLAQLGASEGSLEARRRATEALGAIDEEAALASEGEPLDLESLTTIALVRESLEDLAGHLDDEPARGPGPPLDPEFKDRVAAVLQAWGASAPSRALGRSVQTLQRLAAVVDRVAWRAQRSNVWNPRGARSLGRSIGRVLERLELEALALRAPPSPYPGEVAFRIEALLRSLNETLDGLRQSSEQLAPTRPPAESGTPRTASGGALPASALANAVSASLAAGAALMETAAALEALRPAVAPGADLALERLRLHLGSLSSRVRATAGRVTLAGQEASRLAGGSGGVGAESSPTTRARSAELALEIQKDAEATGRWGRAAHREASRLLRSPRALPGVEEAVGGLDAAAAVRIVAGRLTSLATGELAAAARRLAVGKEIGASASGLLAAASELAEIAALLERVERLEAARAAARQLAQAIDSASSLANLPVAALLERARRLLETARHAAGTVASRLSGDERGPPILERLRDAVARFADAVQAGEKGEAERCAEAIEEGRAALERALELARALSRATREELAVASRAQELEGAETDAEREAQRELAAAQEELRRILELEDMEADLGAQIEQALEAPQDTPGQDPKGDDEARATLAREAEKAQRALEDRHVSFAELVAMVSRLQRAEEEARSIGEAERALARIQPASEEARGALVAKQAEASLRASSLAGDLRDVGARLSAALPLVLRAHWKAVESSERLAKLTETAAGGLTTESLTQAADQAELVGKSVAQLKRAALEAITDHERGDGGVNASHIGLERARRRLEEATRLLSQGDLRGAAGAQRAAGRSIADAAAGIRSRIDRVSDSLEAARSGGPGDVPGAAGVGSEWEARTRGSELREELGLRAAGLADMPYPTAYRDLIHAYMEALGAR